jgi:hypothetical protein
MISILKRLKNANAAYEDLSNSKIGKTIMKLSKHKNTEIISLTGALIEKWKKLKKTDKKTENDETKTNLSKSSTSTSTTNKTGKLKQSSSINIYFKKYLFTSL